VRITRVIRELTTRIFISRGRQLPA